MTIYYLMIKTHNITGLKYLCQTKRNPFAYKGSGKDWKPHLKKYGKDHTTVILQECQSKEELGYWGRHYSQLWNIVNAQDDYGNKIWANRIPETGGGGQHSDETRIKLAASNKGQIPWNKGLTGVMSEEAKARISASKKGVARSKETRDKMSAAKKGIYVPWNKGLLWKKKINRT